MWWNEQTDSMKQKVKSLVERGQLEFINGGYCIMKVQLIIMI